MVSPRVLAIGALVLVPFAVADTVTTKDSRSWNGQCVIQNGVVTLTASFPKGSQALQFGVGYLRALELNPIKFNPGDRPGNLPKATPSNLSGTIYPRNKTEKESTCDQISIDPQKVTCTAKENVQEKGKSKEKTWNRADVIRIIFK
jgi:hypothetical protein